MSDQPPPDTLETVPVPPTRGGGRPPTPFSTQLSGGNVQDQMRRIADALSQKADIGGAPAFAAIALMDPNGVSWRVTVDATGTLRTIQVPRT